MFRTTPSASTTPPRRRRLFLPSSLFALGLGVVLLTAMGCERIRPLERSTSQIALKDGMGLMEAAGALGCAGENEASGMRMNPTNRVTAWNVEWRIGRVYELDETKVVAIYSAWSSEEMQDAPPSSAFRLVGWSMQETRSMAPITLWSGNH